MFERKLAMRKFRTDLERYEYVRKFKLSNMSVSEFASINGIPRGTLRDWINAYNNINGKFINVSMVSDKEGCIVQKEDLTINMLSEIEKSKKSTHFNRFDHSIVVIEYKDIKVTTSLKQAERLLEIMYDQVQGK